LMEILATAFWARSEGCSSIVEDAAVPNSRVGEFLLTFARFYAFLQQIDDIDNIVRQISERYGPSLYSSLIEAATPIIDGMDDDSEEDEPATSAPAPESPGSRTEE